MEQERENSPNRTEDEQAMIQLLHTMGVTKFDPSVPAALNEYAKSRTVNNKYFEDNSVYLVLYQFRSFRVCGRTSL